MAEKLQKLQFPDVCNSMECILPRMHSSVRNMHIYEKGTGMEAWPVDFCSKVTTKQCKLTYNLLWQQLL